VGVPGRKTDELAIAALATGATVEEAAQRAGIGQSTLYRRLQKPEFQAAVRELRAQAVREAAGKLAAAMTKAVGVLEALLSSTSEGVRFRSADRLIDHAVKVAEVLDLERRIQDLERRLAE
jgi:hypothetical protein